MRTHSREVALLPPVRPRELDGRAGRTWFLGYPREHLRGSPSVGSQEVRRDIRARRESHRESDQFAILGGPPASVPWGWKRGEKLAVTIARREVRNWLRESEEGQAVEEPVRELLAAGTQPR